MLESTNFGDDRRGLYLIFFVRLAHLTRTDSFLPQTIGPSRWIGVHAILTCSRLHFSTALLAFIPSSQRTRLARSPRLRPNLTPLISLERLDSVARVKQLYLSSILQSGFAARRPALSAMAASSRLCQTCHLHRGRTRAVSFTSARWSLRLQSLSALRSYRRQ